MELGNLRNLLSLDLSNNRLSDTLAKELGDLKNLEDLDLSDNRLLGELPPELGNLTNLQKLHLENNDFTGELSQGFKNLINMTSLDVQGNNFNGSFNFIAHWKNLRDLILMGNNFERPSPEVFQSLTELQSLHLADITGGFQFPILNSTYLKTLTLRNCSLGDQIPEFIWGNQRLSYLDLSFNNLIGEIPGFASSNLRDIYLRGNKLNKSLPGWFKNITNSYVDVSENSFTDLILPLGNISENWNLFSCCSEIENGEEEWKKANYHCYNEKTLYDDLYINCGGGPEIINGSHYEADLEDSGRSTFFISNDKRWGYSSMGSWNFAYLNHYIVNRTCNVNMAEAPLYTGARIAPISLKYYGFCLKNGNYTLKLHFAEIALIENEDPGSMEMRIFDVEIQGVKELRNFNIAKEAGGVNKEVTKVFNVLVNTTRLEIHLFWAGKGSMVGQFGSYGPLISAISVHRAPGPAKLSAITITGIVVSALVIPALLLVFLWKLGWFGSKGLHDEELKGIELLSGAFFNFRQIKAATQNFSSANKLGEGGFGSVYKGVLPNGTALAVKQLSAKSKQGIREFVNEVGTISALQHPNLVRLLGCCAEDNQLLLVYEYMENNSLAHALFVSEELRLRLNWPTRVKICLGIAKGLAYLHEESKLKIVHRDIKPTNILLDKDLNAKISDFGFAKLYEGEMTHVITKIAGTTGYMAPEYAMRGHLTNKADVYSFGVVTLEIVSGKNSASYRPNDESVYLLDLAYVSQQKGNLIELLDPNLGSDYSSEEAITVLELAMLCTNPSPTLRPTMSEVVKILEGESKIASTPVSAPYSMDHFTMAKHMASLSQSTQFFSSSQEGTSNANSSQAVSKEVKKSEISADCST